MIRKTGKPKLPESWKAGRTGMTGTFGMTGMFTGQIYWWNLASCANR
jgi:hypothetical protein